MYSQIDPRRIARGARVESKEHPWATKKQARQIATDHLAENPRAYPARKRR